MSWSREEALTDPAVRGPMMFVSEFRFVLRDIPTEITIRLYRPIFAGQYVARCSHKLAIPGVSAPALPSDDGTEPNEGRTLHNAVEHLVATYNAAKAQGLVPSTSWLVPDTEFC
jgi:hypothetical protein